MKVVVKTEAVLHLVAAVEVDLGHAVEVVLVVAAGVVVGPAAEVGVAVAVEVVEVVAEVAVGQEAGAGVEVDLRHQAEVNVVVVVRLNKERKTRKKSLVQILILIDQRLYLHISFSQFLHLFI